MDAVSNSHQIHQRCRLLELPREIRDEIYYYALLQWPVVYVKALGVTPNDLASKLALTATCRQIRKESHREFYSINTFYLSLHKDAAKEMFEQDPSIEDSIMQRDNAFANFLLGRVHLCLARLEPCPREVMFVLHSNWPERFNVSTDSLEAGNPIFEFLRKAVCAFRQRSIQLRIVFQASPTGNSWGTYWFDLPFNDVAETLKAVKECVEGQQEVKRFHIPTTKLFEDWAAKVYNLIEAIDFVND